MTVYVEYIFLNNLAINYLISYLTLLAMREKPSILRMLLASGLGAILAVFYQFVTKFDIIIKILLSFLMVLILKKSFKSLKEYLSAVFILYLISFAFAGAILMLDDIINVGGSLLPFSITFGIVIAWILISVVIKLLYQKKQDKNYEYAVTIYTDNTEIECMAYYDSGNKLYDEERGPVIVISQKLKDKLQLVEDGFIAVRTVAGVKMLATVNIKFKIYYEDGVNKIYSTRAAVSTNLQTATYDLILHKDMCV